MVMDEILLKAVVNLTFNEFTDADWDAFGGVEDNHPLICWQEEEVYIIEGEVLTIYDVEELSQMAKLRLCDA